MSIPMSMSISVPGSVLALAHYVFRIDRSIRTFALMLCVLCAGVFSSSLPAFAVQGQLVTLNGLDKVTGRVYEFDVFIGQTTTFGTFEIRPRFCDKRPPVELPETSVFLEIFDIRSGNRQMIFSGWMFESSPGLSAVNHPVYDVWVKDCVPVDAPDSEAATQQ